MYIASDFITVDHQVWASGCRQFCSLKHLIFCGYSTALLWMHEKYSQTRIKQDRESPKFIRIRVRRNAREYNTKPCFLLAGFTTAHVSRDSLHTSAEKTSTEIILTRCSLRNSSHYTDHHIKEVSHEIVVFSHVFQQKVMKVNTIVCVLLESRQYVGRLRRHLE